MGEDARKLCSAPRSNKRCRVILLAPKKVVGGITTWARYLLKYSNREKVEYHVIDTSKLYDALGKKLGCRGAIMGTRDALVRLFVLLIAIKKFSPHLVYFTCAPSIGLVVRDAAFMFLLRLLRIPTIAHLRGGDVDGFFGGNILRRFIVNSALRSCRAVFVITHEMEKASQAIFVDDKVIYVPNMIDDDIVARQSDRHIYTIQEKAPLKLLHVAWQAPEKGSLDLVEAMRYVQTPISCDLVGQAAPEYRELIEKRIRVYKVSDKIRLVGIKTGSDLEKVFEQADIFLLPSHGEGFPNVILEAMAYGLPIIANDVGNIREMIGVDGTKPAGLLLKQVDPIDAAELAKLIDKLAMNPNLRMKLSRNGRTRVRNKYIASKLVPELENLLEELV